MRTETKEKYIARMRYQYDAKRQIFFVTRVIDAAFQSIVVGGAAAVPVLLLITSIPKTIPTIISGIVAITAALANYYKLGERSRIHRTTAQALIKQLDRYDLKLKPYKTLDEDQAFDLFVENTELIMEEHVKQIFSMQPAHPTQEIEIKPDSLSDGKQV